MQKKLIRLTYSKKQIQSIVKNQLDIEAFERHCQEVADKLNIDVVIVRELLIDNAEQVLIVLHDAVVKREVIKVNIYGFFSFTTRFIRKELKIKFVKFKN